jgi:ArsR family transcriptional regulator
MNVDILAYRSTVVNIDHSSREAFVADPCCPSITDAPLAEADAGELAQAFAALADPIRLRLLSLIASRDEGETCACDLVEPAGRSQPTVSHHLKVLRGAGLIEGERRGTWIWYRVVPERLRALRDVLGPPVPATR